MEVANQQISPTLALRQQIRIPAQIYGTDCFILLNDRAIGNCHFNQIFINTYV